jgi:hypothetical protein
MKDKKSWVDSFLIPIIFTCLFFCAVLGVIIMENQRRQNDVREQQGGGEIFVEEHFLIDKHSGMLLSVWGWGNRRIVPNPFPDMLKLRDCIWHSKFGGGEFAKELYVQNALYKHFLEHHVNFEMILLKPNTEAFGSSNSGYHQR